MPVKHRIAPPLVLTLALALTTNSAHTEEPVQVRDPSDPIEEIVVRAQYLSLDQMDAVKTPTPILDIPQSLSIVSAAQIQEQAFQNFGDLLRYTPGLSISQGEGHRDAIIIRGIPTTADFFIDGVRDDVQYYRPLYNVQQVEVLRGSNALLFGRGGGGGVINRVQKKAELGQQFTQLNAGVDSFGAYTGAIDSNIAISDQAALRLNGYYSSLENHRDVYNGEAFAFNPTLTLALSSQTKASVSYEYVNDDRIVDRGVPSRNVEGGPDVPVEGFRDTFFGSAEANETEFEGNIFRARVDHQFNSKLRGNVTLQYADYEKAYANLFVSEEVNLIGQTFSELELDGYRDTTDRENLIIQTNLVGEFNTGRIGHTLLVGAEFGDQQTANARQDNFFPASNDNRLVIPFADPLVIPDFGFTVPVRERESEVTFTSVYVQDQIDITDQLKVVVGFRYDSFDIDVLDVIEENDNDALGGDFARNDNEITPRLGFIYKPLENVSIYASYSETFLPQSGDQFLTLNLDSQSTRPQFFENTEIGVKWDLRADLSLTVALFELERESFTSIDPDDQAQLILIDGSTTEGFEVQLTGQLTDFWAVTTGYSYLDGQVKRVGGGGNDGNRTAQTPENMFSIWNNFRINNRLSLGIGATYQDSFFVGEDNSVEVPSYTRIDLAAFYEMNNRTRVQLNVENALDKNYFPDAHSNDNISTGRPLNARLSLIMDL